MPVFPGACIRLKGLGCEEWDGVEGCALEYIAAEDKWKVLLVLGRLVSSDNLEDLGPAFAAPPLKELERAVGQQVLQRIAEKADMDREGADLDDEALHVELQVGPEELQAFRTYRQQHNLAAGEVAPPRATLEEASGEGEAAAPCATQKEVSALLLQLAARHATEGYSDTRQHELQATVEQSRPGCHDLRTASREFQDTETTLERWVQDFHRERDNLCHKQCPAAQDASRPQWSLLQDALEEKRRRAANGPLTRLASAVASTLRGAQELPVEPAPCAPLEVQGAASWGADENNPNASNSPRRKRQPKGTDHRVYFDVGTALDAGGTVLPQKPPGGGVQVAKDLKVAHRVAEGLEAAHGRWRQVGRRLVDILGERNLELELLEERNRILAAENAARLERRIPLPQPAEHLRGPHEYYIGTPARRLTAAS